jgi:DNA polymerase
MTDPQRRRQYLAELGIPLWLPRRDGLLSAAAAETPVPTPASDPALPPSLPEPAAAAPDPVAADLPLDRDIAPLDTDWEPCLDVGVDIDVDLDLDMDMDMDMDVDVDDDAPRPAPLSRAARIATLDWTTLEAEVRQCQSCGLCTTRTQTVFGVGDRQARWLVVGEAPGADEDRQGEPFVGRAGKLLNPMLQAIGLRREQVYIANILKCRPPDNRDPAPDEATTCRPFLERQIALLQPRIILAVGRIAAQNLLATDTPIGKLRGRIHRLGLARIPLVVTYHPAYLLRSPREKRKAWDDLRLARRALANPAATP